MSIIWLIPPPAPTPKNRGAALPLPGSSEMQLQTAESSYHIQMRTCHLFWTENRVDNVNVRLNTTDDDTMRITQKIEYFVSLQFICIHSRNSPFQLPFSLTNLLPKPAHTIRKTCNQTSTCQRVLDMLLVTCQASIFLSLAGHGLWVWKLILFIMEILCLLGHLLQHGLLLLLQSLHNLLTVPKHRLNGS